MFVFIHQMGPGGKTITSLLAESGPFQGKIFHLKQEKTHVGKASNNEIVLTLPEIEDVHLQIDLSGPQPFLRDKGGISGTWVNDKRVKEIMLKHGDKISFASAQSKAAQKEKGSEILMARQPIMPITDDVRTIMGNHTRMWGGPPRPQVTPSRGAPPQPTSAAASSFQQRKLEVLLAVSKALSRPEEVSDKVNRVLELLFETMEIDRAALLVVGEQPGEDGNQFTWSAYRDRRGPTEEMELSSTIINRVLQEGLAVLTQDAQNEDWLDGARSVLGQEIRSCVCTPLKTSSGILGVLYADSMRPASQPFSREDMDFFTAFSSQAANAIENTRLLRVALEKERLEQDLDIARKIQRMLFPKDLPQLNGYQLAGDSFAMDQVGGDYFDYLLLDERHLALVVADVSGHGVSSSLVMTMTRSILRGSLTSQALPSQLLQRVNQLVSEDMLPRMFVTMLLVVVDLHTGQYTLSSAGHPPLLHYHAQQNQVQAHTIKSPPLGMSRWARLKPRYKDLQGQLLPGDQIFLYTDGITEAANESGDQFEDHLERVFLRCARQEPKAVIAHISEIARAFCGEQPIADDYTSIAFQRLSPT